MILPRTTMADVKQTPRGSVVVLGDRLLTDEVTNEYAVSLAININEWITAHNVRLIDGYYRRCC